MICTDCGQEMMDGKTFKCTRPIIIIDGQKYKRNTEYYDNGTRCHDCNIVNAPGHVHHLGCDIERCPICDGQLISCGHFTEVD